MADNSLPQALAPSRLAEIANTVNAAHKEIDQAMRASLRRAVEVGQLLTEAKALVKHGGWLDWLKTNCEFSERTAQNYMRLADRYPELEKSATVADLTYRGAIAFLAEPTTLEGLIAFDENDKNSFIDTTKALIEIRDNCLYRAEFATFEDYCRDKWGINNQVMDVAESVLDAIQSANVELDTLSTQLEAADTLTQVMRIEHTATKYQNALAELSLRLQRRAGELFTEVQHGR